MFIWSVYSRAPLLIKVSVLGVLDVVVVSGCTSSSCASCTFCTSRPSPGGGSSISYPSKIIKLTKYLCTLITLDKNY